MPEANLVVSDMMSLNFEPASLDGVVALYSIIHLPRDEQAVMIQRLGEWTKEGGCILINLCAEESAGTYAKGWLGGDDMFWSGFGAEWSRKLVEDAGFTVLDAEIKQATGDAAFLWILAIKGKKAA